MRIRVASLVALTLTLALQAPVVRGQATRPAADGQTVPAQWQSIGFLLGDWTAEPDATGAKGAFSFHLDLSGRVVERRGFAEYPAASGRLRHEDLMILYPPPAPGGPINAIYFDSEGHTIHYSVTTSLQSVVFESDPSDPGPRFRLSYKQDGNRLDGTFEIRAPGKPDYQPYLAWKASRTSPSK